MFCAAGWCVVCAGVVASCGRSWVRMLCRACVGVHISIGGVGVVVVVCDHVWFLCGPIFPYLILPGISFDAQFGTVEMEFRFIDSGRSISMK